MQEQKVNISVCTPDKDQDFQLPCDLSWSVKKLKEEIQKVHPTKPEVSFQRLLYRGKLLENADSLSSLLQPSDVPHVMQLSLIGRDSTDDSSAQASSSTADQLRHRHHVTTNESKSWQPSGPHPYYQPYPYPQYAATHEQYAEMWKQYYQQVNDYMRYYNGLSNPNATQPTTAAPSPSVTNQPVPETNPSAAAPAAAPADAAPAGAPAPGPRANAPEANPPMNAQGGFAAADNDDLMPHDWLDFLFTLFRYSFFLSIIYFYSTFWRFLLVAGFFLALYVYQAGFLQAQRRQAQPNEAEREVNARADPPAATDDNNNNSDENTDDPTEVQAPLPPPPPSIFATAWCFITTFFSSLIPQPPPVV